MKILLLSDFGGVFPEAFRKKLKAVDFDVVLCAGDFADIKAIRDLFLKYGEKSDEVYNKMSGKEKDRINKKRHASTDSVLKKLNSLGKPIYLVTGNNEIYYYEKFLKILSKYKNCRIIDGRLAEFKGFSVIGNRNENTTKSEEQRGYTLENLYDYQEHLLDKNFKKSKGKNIILVNHYPPYGGRLDKMPKDARQNPGRHVGSYLIKDAIRKYKPKFVLCGHLEELRGICRIGKTTVINPGGADIGKYGILEVNKKDFRKSNIVFYPNI